MVKAKNEKKDGKWFAVLVIILFIMSTFSIMLYATNDNNEDDSNTTTLDPISNLTLNYTANLQGIIKEYPVKGFFIVQGITSNSLTEEIDLQLKDINNVYSVESSIKLLDSNNLENINYMYTAQILGPELDYYTFLLDLKDKNIFSEVLVYPSATVDYNSYVVFVNNDLNLTKEYDIGGNEITVLMHPENFDNVIGDKISFGIYATFNGELLKSYMSEQINNITANPVTITSLYTAVPKKLGYNVLILNADKNFEEKDFDFVKSLGYDFNYFAQENNAQLSFDLQTNFSKFIIDANTKLVVDYNANVNYAIDASLFVDKITYMDKNYDVNSDVALYSDFSGNAYPGLNYLKYKDSEELQYTITAYLVRDKVTNANAEVIQEINN